MPKIEVEVMSSKFWHFFFVAEKSFKSRRLILGRAGGM